MLPKRALKPDRPEGGSVDLFSPSLLQSLLSLSFWVVIYLYFFHLCAHVSIPFSIFPSFLHISLYLLSFSSLSPSPPYILFFITIPSSPTFPLALSADGLIMSGVKDVSPSSCRIMCASQRLLSRAWREREMRGERKGLKWQKKTLKRGREREKKQERATESYRESR